MAKTKTEPFVPYKETRLSIEPASKSSIFLPLPPHGVLNRTFGTPARRQQRIELPLAKDEVTFAKLHLATSSSIYFRKGPSVPRSFLWRVLEDGKVLVVQAVDINKEIDGPDPCLTLRFSFPTAIRPDSVTFSDSQQHDPLYIFVLTVSNELYTLTLRSDFFSRLAATEGNVGDWCKSFLASSFSFRHPHRLFARSPQQLLVSTHDGGLLRLTRKASDDGSFWVETFYNDGGWGSSLRGLIPWQGNYTVRYGNANLEYSTVTSIAVPSDLESPHIFTVTLNHNLKIWNLLTGKVVFTRDLLGLILLPQEAASYLIQPSLPHLVEVVSEGLKVSDQYYLITLSPRAYKFKFWALRDADESEMGLRDLFPEADFEPPFPGTGSDIWTLAQFHVVPMERKAGEERKWVLWVLWKRDKAWELSTLEFDPYDVAAAWKDKWTAVGFETFPDVKVPKASHLEVEDATEKWIEYLFFPGRFTVYSLETAIALYRQDVSDFLPDSMERTSTCLKDQICAVVASMISLERNHDGHLDLERYRIDTNKQWTRFSRLVSTLEKQQREAVAFAYDDRYDLPFVVMADGVSTIRDCCDQELLQHNNLDLLDHIEALRDWTSRSNFFGLPLAEPVRLANLLNTALNFWQRFPASLLHSCNAVILSEVFQDPSYSVQDQIRSFYDRCDFVKHISDVEYIQLVDASESFGGLGSLDTPIFQATLEIVRQKTWPAEKEEAKLWMTAIGERVLLRGAQEILHLNWNILCSLLVLLVFIDVEVFSDDDEQDRASEMDTAHLYESILVLLRETGLMKWLTRTRLQVPHITSDRVAGKSSRQRKLLHPDQQMRPTAFEYVYLQGWPHPQPYRKLRPQTMALSYSIKRSICPREITTQYDVGISRLMCIMIVSDNIDIASEIVRFLPNSSWATYLKARLYLCQQDFPLAASSFKKAAFGLARGRPDVSIGVEESENLLDLTDVENINNNGLPKYHLHVLGLFEKARAHTYVKDFAKLALQFTNPNKHEYLRTELLSRLFHSSIQTSHFDEAYTAMTQYTDTALQNSALNTLVSHMISQNEIPHLLSLPFLGLQSTVDSIISSLCGKAFSLTSGPQYHRVLYAWRISRGDFRGAAEVLFERLQRLQSSARGRANEEDNQADNQALQQEFLALINLLATVEPGQAWVLASPAAAKASRKDGADVEKRKVVTLDDVRREYQAELDRVAIIEGNQFAFGGGDGADMDLL